MAIPTWTVALVCACIVVAIAALVMAGVSWNSSCPPADPPRTLAVRTQLDTSTSTFPVDVVFTWCNRTPEWEALKRQYQAHTSSSEPPSRNPLPCDNNGDCELHYAVRSVQLFMPWVRTIYILTQRPQDPHIPGTVTVFHDQVIPPEHRDALPTFNSHAIESFLHHIPGLAEHFVYFNDDMFVGKPLTVDTFFQRDGLPIFYHNGKYTKKRMFVPITDGFLAAWRNLYHLLKRSHNRVVYCHIHQATALTKTICAHAESVFPELWKQVRYSRVRDTQDVPPVALCLNLAMFEGKATLIPGKKLPNFVIHRAMSASAMNKLAIAEPILFCINNVSSSQQWRIAQSFLNKLLQHSPNSSSSVPKLLWQTWHSRPLPPHMADAVNALKAAHPDFQHSLLTQSECEAFIRNSFPSSVADAFNTLVPAAFKADLWRLCVLYKLGGVYVDVKFVPVGNFSFHTMLDSANWVRDRPVNKRVGIYNGCMIAAPGDVRLYHAIQHIVHNVQTKYYGLTTLDPTGPQLLAYYIHPQGPDVTMKYQHDSLKKCAITDLQGRKLLKSYPQYREEQKAHQREPRYRELWEQRAIYAETV